MELISFDVLKESPLIIKDIRWDVTPKIFFNPSSTPSDESGESVDTTFGYMLYVDLIDDKPALVIMQLKPFSSKTVGYVFDIPVELLREAMHCTESDCIGGMYPLTEKLEGWLKKEFGLS
jgi:hypothetical protein